MALFVWLFPALLGATFPVAVDGTPKSGTISVPSESHDYTFTANAGQFIFYQGISRSETFAGKLSCKLFGPAGQMYFDRFFSVAQNRIVLETTGTYTLRVYVYNPAPTTVGSYSFSLTAIPADDQFSIKIGDTVNESTPGGGSGRISSLGREQYYSFDGVAGQNVIFEDLAADAAFGGTLSWKITTPGGGVLFDRYITGSRTPGRLTLKETGKYKIRIYFYGSPSPTRIGAYSFRLTPLAADVTYPISIGTTVSDGVPAVGAGRISTLGEEDYYTFSATAGQIVVFEDLSAAAAFRGSMAWMLFDPTGAQVFDRYITGAKAPGRLTLAKTGQYRIRAYVYNSTDSTRIGAYSFRLTSLGGDVTFPIRIGEVVSDGHPAAGAGRIAARGEEDLYTFFGKAGRVVVFEDLGADSTFNGRMTWVLRDPSGVQIFDRYLTGGKGPGAITLQTNGTYSIRAYVYNSTSPAEIGVYSFRTYSPVIANNDRLATLPGTVIEVPLDKILFNDSYGDGDSPTVDLPQSVTAKGGNVTRTATGIRYTPAVGFQGVDDFAYRLSGVAGGVSTAHVSVYVAPDANQFATMVGYFRTSTDHANLCILGAPNATYQIEITDDFSGWVDGDLFSTDATGGALLSMEVEPGVPFQFSRFRKK